MEFLGTAVDELQQATLRVYDTVANPSIWPEMLDCLVERIGAQGCIFFEWVDAEESRRLTAPIFSGFYSAEGLQTYLRKCAHLEARDQEALRSNTRDDDGIDLIDDSVLAASKTELENDEHMRTLRRFGIFHRAAGVLNKDNRWLSLFSVQLKETRGQLTAKERHYLNQLLPHFAKAMDLGFPMRQLHRQAHGMLTAIDQLTIGLCLLDSAGNVMVMNEEFCRQKDNYRAFTVSRDGKLGMTDVAGQAAFRALTSSPRCHGKFGARPRKEAIATSAEDSFLCIEVSPLNRSDEIGTGAFSGYLISSTDTSRPIQCNIAPMRDAFGLTQAELSLVEAIGEGLTNPQIADQRGRSVATINAQVKSILSKSQCATRAQFVRMMMRFGANLLSVGR